VTVNNPLVKAITRPQPAILNVGHKRARISRASVTALAIALMAVTGWFDYVTGDF
jgi:hypothetical protein